MLLDRQPKKQEPPGIHLQVELFQPLESRRLQQEMRPCRRCVRVPFHAFHLLKCQEWQRDRQVLEQWHQNEDPTIRRLEKSDSWQ